MDSSDTVTASGTLQRLAFFFAANVLFGAGLFFHAFLYNFYLDALGHNEAIMGVAAAALTAGGLVALLPAGAVVDRIGPRVAYLVATGVGAAGLVFGALVVRPIPIYLAAFAAGLGTASWRVSMGPILMQLAVAGVRSRAFSWNVALLVGSGAAWMTSAGALTEWFEAGVGLSNLHALRVALLVGAAGTAVAAIPFSMVRLAQVARAPGSPAPPSAGPREEAPTLGSWSLPRNLLGAIGFVALWMIGPALVLPFFNLFFLREYALTVDRIGVIFGLTHAVTALVIFGSGELAARVGPRRLLAGWTLLFGPTLWLLAGVDVLGVAVALYLVQGIVSPATNPLIDQILLEEAPEDRRGAVSSWRNGATEVAGIVGATVGGAVLGATSFGVLFAVTGGLGLIAAVALSLVLRRV